MTSAPSHSEPLEVSEAAVRHMAEAMRPSKREQPIQTHLCNAFQALGLGVEVAVPIGGREADIVVTDRNTVVGGQATGTCDIREAIAGHPAMKQLNGLVRRLLPQHTTNSAE